MPRKKVKVLDSPIKSSLKVAGKLCFGEGNTILEAISNLKPEVPRGVGVLTLEKGQVKRERILPRNIVSGLFGQVSRVSKELALKNVSQLFDPALFE